MIGSYCEGKRLLVRQKSTGYTLRDGCKVRVARERSTKARQRAVEGGLHGSLRHVEHAPDLREAQLPETAQVDDRTKRRRQRRHGLKQRTAQVAPLSNFLGQGFGIGDSLYW